MKRRFKQLPKEDRLAIELLSRRKTPVKEIAEEVGVHKPRAPFGAPDSEKTAYSSRKHAVYARVSFP